MKWHLLLKVGITCKIDWVLILCHKCAPSFSMAGKEHVVIAAVVLWVQLVLKALWFYPYQRHSKDTKLFLLFVVFGGINWLLTRARRLRQRAEETQSAWFPGFCIFGFCPCIAVCWSPDLLPVPGYELYFTFFGLNQKLILNCICIWLHRITQYIYIKCSTVLSALLFWKCILLQNC